MTLHPFRPPSNISGTELERLPTSAFSSASSSTTPARPLIISVRAVLGPASMGMMIGEGRQVRSFQGNLIHALRTIMGAYKPESIVRDAISGFLWKEMKGQVRTDEESCAAGIVGLTAALVKLLA